ncbi:16S rRNA (cytosine(967)-C(5))-methyltransferase RsmB [Listeria costaricensis]|uniref:16S rRNA (cytosine(967)-C(5))-methyltransferase RsmB n=1 Tax=Listeria costaricensis TaxID=2026604 RepID=UPI000C06B0F6|nr:16S rRNA (cytosine(967)-C(5))-methyltransferase RsmB [Listeria costaricensis]
MKTVRELALESIQKIEKNGSYSHLLINEVLKGQNIKPVDKALLTELVYGTIQRKLTLDFYLSPFLKKEPEDWVRNLLRLSVYQMVYLDKIPAHAILHEAGEITKTRGHQGITKFVNGVLRNIERKGLPAFSTIQDPVKRLAIQASLPEWLAERWIHQYGPEKAAAIGEAFLTPPHQSIRVNKWRTSREAVQKELAEAGIETTPSAYIEEALLVDHGTIAETPLFKDGLISIQDESSMLVAHALRLEEGLQVLDACAAPGGKTTHIAEKMRNTGQVTALDIHAHKTKLIRQAVKRIGLRNVQTKEIDARTASRHFEPASFDRVLVDAPCTGFGVLRRKPDIKYQKTAEDIHRLHDIQLAILADVSQLVKDNGILVYSTCTIDQEENRQVAEAFLAAHPSFELIDVALPEKIAHLQKNGYLELLPTDIDSDGFFVASFQKRS